MRSAGSEGGWEWFSWLKSFQTRVMFIFKSLCFLKLLTNTARIIIVFWVSKICRK